MKMVIHEKQNWTDFTWDNNKVMIKFGEARNQQGRLLGKMESRGFDLPLTNDRLFGWYAA